MLLLRSLPCDGSRKLYSSSFAHRDTTIKNAHHRLSCDRMAASRSRTRNAMIFFVGCCVARSRIPRRNQPSSLSLLAIQRTTVRLLPLSSNQQRLLLSSFDWQHEKFDCCVLASRDGRIAVVAPRQYDCFPQHQNCYVVASLRWETCSRMRLRHHLLGYDVKNTLVPVPSCNTTCKKSSSSWLLSRMTIKLFAHCDTA